MGFRGKLTKFKKYPATYSIYSTAKGYRQDHLTRQVLGIQCQELGEDRRTSAGFAELTADARDKLRRTLKSRPLCFSKYTDRPRVLWCGASEEQDSSGFLQELARFSDVHLARRPSGLYGLASDNQNPHRTRYDPEVVRGNSLALWNSFERASAERPVDVVFGQMWANFVDPEVLQAFRDSGAIVINYSMDDMLPEHWIDEGHVKLGAVGLAKSVDLTLTTTECFIPKYERFGANIMHLPLASSEEIFWGNSNETRPIDVTFVGSRYGFRDGLIRSLMKMNLSVVTAGSGWSQGPISASATAQLFRLSKVVLGCGLVGHSRTVSTLKLRDFDATMSGAAYLTTPNRDLDQLLHPGVEYVPYESIKECSTELRALLANSQRRLQIAKAGQKRTREFHTWSSRFTHLFSTLKTCIAD